jgi:hypothetical protein
MAYFSIPKKFDAALELEIDEEVYIIKENTNPTKIIFCRGTKKNRIVSFISKVQNWNHKQKKWYEASYAIAKAPEKLIPNQKKCEKLLLIEDIDEDFLIILR